MPIDVDRADGSIVAAICDDGIGFDQTSRALTEFPRFGLSTMRERAESIGGDLTIDSAPGKGTTVRFSAPDTGSAP